MENTPHRPVLLQECLSSFQGVNIQHFIDGTLGAGGHALGLLQAHDEIRYLLGIDQDPQALAIAKNRLLLFSDKIDLVHGNFVDLSDIISQKKCPLVDGILVDLGVSSMQFDTPERGFSFRFDDSPLDMRMNPNEHLTAYEIINTWEERDLVLLFFKYGEESQARRFAKAICTDRKSKPFESTKELADLIKRLSRNSKKEIHPATQVFQALRIQVNRELERLENFLPQALHALRVGGRLAVITFHSLEDRIVKQQFVHFASDKQSTSGYRGLFAPKKQEAIILTRKAMTPSEKEVQENPRSRSAKLRVIEKV